MGKKAQKAQPVVNGDDYHILAACKTGAITDNFAAGTGHHAAAMDPDEDRQPGIWGLGRRPDIQIQAILFILGRCQELRNPMDVGRRFRILHDMLDRRSRIRGGLSHTAPAARILRMPKPQRTHRGCRIGDALEDFQLSFSITLEPALRHLNLRIFKICHLNSLPDRIK